MMKKIDEKKHPLRYNRVLRRLIAQELKSLHEKRNRSAHIMELQERLIAEFKARMLMNTPLPPRQNPPRHPKPKPPRFPASCTAQRPHCRHSRSHIRSQLHSHRKNESD